PTSAVHPGPALRARPPSPQNFPPVGRPVALRGRLPALRAFLRWRQQCHDEDRQTPDDSAHDPADDPATGPVIHGIPPHGAKSLSWIGGPTAAAVLAPDVHLSLV